jgi:hypothetical protein
MEPGSDKIIVFRQFENVIEANIAKTKLDAYGIPCFLTEENIANLYPGQPFLPFRVRLHLFKKDIGEACGILDEPALRKVTSEQQACPRCASENVQRDFPKSLSIKPLAALRLMFFGVLFPHKKVNHCLDCDYEY